MPFCRKRYYFGSYGLIRGYGPLCRTMGDADASIFADRRKGQENGGSTDRCVVAVSRDDGLCWWVGEDIDREWEMAPVLTVHSGQARYSLELIARYEGLWGTPQELAGFG